MPQRRSTCRLRRRRGLGAARGGAAWRGRRGGSRNGGSSLRRRHRGIGGGLIPLIGFERAQPRDVLLMLVVVFRKHVTAAAVGDEIQFARPRRIAGCFKRGA